ncbi:MAG: biotin synthase BioB [Eubacteriales bacterium]|nr:biotin synthase BioB [Eubacteriales bacterium]
MQQLTKDIIAGKRLGREDDLSFFMDVDLELLAMCANEIREALCGNHVDLCTIINGRAGKCSEDCKFCAQSAHNHTGCEAHGVLEPEAVLEDCKAREAVGVNAYSIVTAGRAVEGNDLDTLVDTYALLHEECDVILCASHGLISEEAFARLKKAGVTRYHANIETSKRNFPNICTTHTYEDKLTEIRMAKEAGLMVCSGGIIGMGESFEDRLDMAISLAELEITSIPINALIPVEGTPFATLEPLTEDEIIRTVAMFRFVNPTAYIRMAAGRNYFKDGGRRLFASGANATITGDMLTTIGNNTKQDMEMLQDMGFCWKEE